MKKGSYFLALFAFFFGSVASLSAQRYDSLLNILDTKYTQEKMYLHFDRAVYNPGETIWFKAYLFTASLPSQISKTVYAELIDDKGKVLKRTTSPVVSSSAAAAFDLPANFSSSIVYVRAYTDWMLNFDSSYLFFKAIPVIQASKAEGAAASLAPKNFLQFFPEGGDLVQGISSKVAFKATDGKGLPVKVNGDILNSKGKSVTTFSSVHDGMGYFTFIPEPLEKYKASWKNEAGKIQLTDLPVAKKQGLVLSVEQDHEGIRFAATLSEGEVKPTTSVNIVGQMHQQMVYMARANISSGKAARGTIPTADIPAGILQITVFSQDEKPLAERIVFVNKQDYYFITDLNAALKGYEKRKKNVIQIDVPDTLKSNLSVSVTDADIDPPQAGADDIFSHVLLTGDIRGYVHHPSYYFSSEVDSVIKHLDLVMMTNGWRRFSWEEVLAGKFPKIQHLPEDYIAIKGRINGLNKAQLTRQELTGILEISGKQQFMNIPIEPQGTFDVPGMVFYDTAKLFYQFNNDKDKVLTSRASFDIKNNLTNGISTLKPDTAWSHRYALPNADALRRNREIAEKNNQLLADQRKKVQTLETVTIVAKQKSKKDQMEDDYTSGLFKGGDGYTFILEDDPLANAQQSVFTYLQGKVAGLQITVSGPNASLSWRGGSPSLFLNEMQGDVNLLQSMPMSDVAMIKVFRPPFLGASGGGAGGAIAVYTKKGAARNQDIKGLDFARVPGYTPVRQFYSPDYMKYDESHAQGDFRPTLYWNPFILTDKNSRRALFTFYNNDITRRFRIVIEGCNEQGKLTRMEKIFQP